MMDRAAGPVRPAARAPSSCWPASGRSRRTRRSSRRRSCSRRRLVSVPFALLILLAVFASVVAAGLPLARRRPRRSRRPSPRVFLVAQTTELSIYVQNVATMLGLALAIDYSLFMVSRFREELGAGRDGRRPPSRSRSRPSGKAVAFSGLAVAIGLSGLLLFEPPALRSFGIGGSIVVGRLGLLRADVPAGGPRHARAAGQRAQLRRAVRDHPAGDRPAGRRRPRATRTSRWERVAHCGHGPARSSFLIPTLAFLLFAGTPFLRLSRASPTRRPSRRASRAATPPSPSRRDFRARRDLADHRSSPTVEGDPTSEANVPAHRSTTPPRSTRSTGSTGSRGRSAP